MIFTKMVGSKWKIIFHPQLPPLPNLQRKVQVFFTFDLFPFTALSLRSLTSSALCTCNWAWTLTAAVLALSLCSNVSPAGTHQGYIKILLYAAWLCGGITLAMIGSVHKSIHPPEMELNPQKPACGLPLWRGEKAKLITHTHAHRHKHARTHARTHPPTHIHPPTHTQSQKWNSRGYTG